MICRGFNSRCCSPRYPPTLMCLPAPAQACSCRLNSARFDIRSVGFIRINGKWATHRQKRSRTSLVHAFVCSHSSCFLFSNPRQRQAESSDSFPGSGSMHRRPPHSASVCPRHPQKAEKNSRSPATAAHKLAFTSCVVSWGELCEKKTVILIWPPSAKLLKLYAEHPVTHLPPS